MKKISATLLVALIVLAGSCLSAYASGNDPRTKPGHPSNVTGLHLIRSKISLNSITLAWNLNKRSEAVDLYAVYFEGESQPPFAQAWKVVRAHSVKILFTDLGVGRGKGESPDRMVWVIAHNKNGWGENDSQAADPDENFFSFVRKYSTDRAHRGTVSVFDLDHIDITSSK